MQNGNCPKPLVQGTTAVSSTAVRSPNTEIASALLPCPFCGNPPAVEMTGFHLGGRTIRCETDDCMGPHTTAACMDDALIQWNRRAATPLVDNLTGASSTDTVNCPPSSFDARREEIARAAARFVMWALMEGSWQGCDIDGGAAQDKAVELGLIVEMPYDPAKHGEQPQLELGESWFVASDAILALCADTPLSRPERKSIENAGE